ncbi:GGDEF domain-containing protein [Acinetobacter sp. ANC 5054]|uniref:GGDEF domain-containing protein n=1 Tax=Acinetobacter sp. ANC 5054 TaxID=1977877 RepID=UPI000A349BB9|nr:diguanylate cyclase [Acinetobacter sp. ANC 5054]OTG82686.1 GGDEF domain-containing protein [Acinetobacter sp. ANC 5054]
MKLKGSRLLSRQEIDNLIRNKLNRVYFTKNLEPIYRQQYQNEAAYEFRFRGIIIFILYALLSYGIYHLIPTSRISILWSFLYLWVGVIILCTWLLSFYKKFNQYFDLYTGIGSTIAVAISFIIVTSLSDNSNDVLLYAAMMYAVVIIYGFIGMRFYQAMLAVWFGGLIGFLITKLFNFNIDWNFLNRTYTYTSFLGMAMAYAIDRQHRENYLQNCIIELNQFEMLQQSEQLKLLSEQDSLTGLANRRHLSQVLEQQWRYALRHKQPFSILMVDIDFFKNYNDQLGHQAGDLCLKTIAKELKMITNRSGELAARYGGEEFLLLFPMVDDNEISSLAAYLIHRVQNLKLLHPDSNISDFVTISIGAASIIPDESINLDQFIRSADTALYHAKENGRNQFYISPSMIKATLADKKVI